MAECLPPFERFAWSTRGEGVERVDVGRYGSFVVRVVIEQFPATTPSALGTVRFVWSGADLRVAEVRRYIPPASTLSQVDPPDAWWKRPLDSAEIDRAMHGVRTAIAEWIEMVAPIPDLLGKVPVVEGPADALRFIRVVPRG